MNRIIGIGFCGLVNSNHRMPGWFQRSWAYHGDDGKLFIQSGSGKTPSADFGDSGMFGQGDVVGVGLDMKSGQGFCTRNGKRLDMGDAFETLHKKFNFGKLYPCVGFSLEGLGVGLHFRVNFDGSKDHPFKFEE
ncbi:unnamed protein product [Clonostachys rosea]|uniref:B30.2/SPRY domain-containing protein n=1 Tax=Bionectria ochroleuca TaxID=29856 RepID=A0ABY6UY15_BIOOC|nr:unnamed protein product [Clonostachys rosea]